ncbi:MAG: DUF268 domain-containing protein [Chlamydiales bacterium]|nr:DUF268 domain-containing protein [Chlamydiales bacterium]
MESFTQLCLIEAIRTFPIRGKSVVLMDPFDSNDVLFLSSQGIELLDPLEDRMGQVVCMLSLLRKAQEDPAINDRDLQLMRQAKKKIPKDGLLYLSIPIAKDGLVGSSYRVYGESRMKKLFQGWRPAGYFGYSYEDVLNNSFDAKEPIIVLRSL